MKHTKKKREEISFWCLLPLFLASWLTPLIVITHDYVIDFTSFDWFSNNPIDTIDTFEYGKGIFVSVMGVIGLAALLYILCTKKGSYLREKQNRKIFVIGLLYLAPLVLSSMFGNNFELAIWGGGYGQWQTLWVMVSYTILFLLAYLLLTDEKQIFILIKGMFLTVILLTILGVLQTAGSNPLKWDWLQNMITTFSEYDGFSLSEYISDVVLTFPNPNYVGSYVAIVFPIITMLIFVNYWKSPILNMVNHIVSLLVCCGLLVIAVGSDSLVSILSVVLSMGIALIFILSRHITVFKRGEKIYKRVFSISGFILMITVLVIVITNQSLKDKIAGSFLGEEDTRSVKNIITQDDKIEIKKRDGNILFIKPNRNENDQITNYDAYDNNNKQIKMKWYVKTGEFIAEDDRFNMLSVSTHKYFIDNSMYEGFLLTDREPNNISWIFVFKDNALLYYTPFGKTIKLHEVESFGFHNLENMANRRGYIWSRTIPLMKQYFFIGAGPNSFITAFPNEDFVGSKRVGNTTALIDKSHNTYLQIFIQNGGISAMAYIMLLLVYLCGSIKIFWRRKLSSNMEKIGFGIFIGIIGYALSGITNDSIIGAAHLYWILLGTGFSVNRFLVKSQS